MNTRAFTLALVIAFVAVFMVYTYIEDQKTELVNKYGTNVSVIVAKRDIAALELLDDQKVTVKTVPKSFASPGRFEKIDEIENKLSLTPIMKGEQITKPRVTVPDVNTGLSNQVSSGKRAIAIQVDEKQSVSGLIKPGDRVDVISPIDPTSGQKDMQRITTILQDVLVLSTGKSMTNSIPIYGIKTPKEIKKMNAQVYERYNTVTLELTPYEVQKVVHHLTFSGFRPWLSLRNNNDRKVVPIKSTDIFNVVGEDERAEFKNYFLQLNKKKGR